MPSVYANNKIKKQSENDAWTKLYKLVPENAHVLDVGCSSGNFGHVLMEEKNCKVTGIDINEEDLKLAEKRLDEAYKINIESDDISQLGKFDVVLMADVIEHLVDPLSALKKIRKVIKNNGKLIFSVPNMANIANRIELLKGRFEYTDYGLLDHTHLHYYDRVELEQLLARAGFAVDMYDNTIREAPEPALIKELKNIGLNPSERFLKQARSLDATTFQFVGLSTPVDDMLVKHGKLTSKTPHDFISTMIDAQTESINALSAHVKELNARIVDLTKERDNLSLELKKIYDSRGWKLLDKVYGFKHKFLVRGKS